MEWSSYNDNYAILLKYQNTHHSGEHTLSSSSDYTSWPSTQEERFCHREILATHMHINTGYYTVCAGIVRLNGNLIHLSCSGQLAAQQTAGHRQQATATAWRTSRWRIPNTWPRTVHWERCIGLSEPVFNCGISGHCSQEMLCLKI